MNNYQNKLDDIVNLIDKGTLEKRNYIIVGDNASGKSEILLSFMQRKGSQLVYFIDSVNRTFDPAKVELQSKSYQYMNLTPDCVISDRIACNNFNLCDTFKALSCIEQLYSKYKEKLTNMCKCFLGTNIHIEREQLEAGLIENKVIIDGEEAKLSSGYQAVMRIFCEILYFYDVMEAQNWQHAVVVIDEIDEYLSPRYSARILNFLQKEFAELNFVVTTHSIDLVENTENTDIIVINDTSYMVHGSEELKNDILVDDIFTALFFKEKMVHISDNDIIDESLRRLLSLKIAGEWNEVAENELQNIKQRKVSPHQQMLCKQIEEW